MASVGQVGGSVVPQGSGVTLIRGARQRAATANARTRTSTLRPPIPVHHRSLDEIAESLDRSVTTWSARFDAARESVEVLEAHLRTLAPLLVEGSIDARRLRAVRELLQLVNERLYTANSQVQLSRSQTAIITHLAANERDAARALDAAKRASTAQSARASRANVERHVLALELRAADDGLAAASASRCGDTAAKRLAVHEERSTRLEAQTLRRERDDALEAVAQLRVQLDSIGSSALARERDSARARIEALEGEVRRMQKERSGEAVARYEAERDAADLREELRLRAAGGTIGGGGGLLGFGVVDPHRRPATAAAADPSSPTGLLGQRLSGEHRHARLGRGASGPVRSSSALTITAW